jgi:glycine cleavage system aminomethyltransferase T
VRPPGATPTPAVSAGDEVVTGEKAVGRLTSVSWSPGFEAVVALGYLHRDVDPPAPVAIRTGSGAVVAAEALVLPLIG